MSAVEAFIYEKEGEQREIMLTLHDMMVHQLGLLEKIRFKIPFYYNRTWICYLNPVKNNGIDLAFIRGNELSNEQGILESRGRKQVRSISLYANKEIPLEPILEILQEAILLDETVPYQSKRKMSGK